MQQVTLVGERLTRSFGDGDARAIVVRDVSLTLEGGKFTMIIGPSGSGKSTLLALLSGLLRPDNGRVIPLGVDLWQMTDAARRRFRLAHYGFIFQGFHLFPSLNARQQLEIVLRWGQGMRARQARAKAMEVLELLGLGPKSKLLPLELSGGEKQRVAIGRALVKDPGFFFVDEPTSSLDWERGKQVIELLRDAAHQRGAAVFLVSHDTRVLPFADCVLRMEDGQLSSTNSEAPLAVTPAPSPRTD
jgi:putative ABC transport system ATP-binding protein